MLKHNSANKFRKRSGKSFSMIAKTMVGLEETLFNEIVAAGGEKVRLLNRAISFNGDTACMYRVNYTCRTALRVLKIIAEFSVNNEDELYNEIFKVNWSDYLNVEQTFAVDAILSKAPITNSHYAAQKVKDAVVDQFRKKEGNRPSVRISNPDVLINLHLTGNWCTLSLDSSGESLHKRGYRKWQGDTPISELLAAGMIMIAGWNGQKPFYDPMCGSGTLLIEAAMIAAKIPSGYHRKSYGFMNWLDFDNDTWTKVKDEANGKIVEIKQHIIGSDVNQKTLSLMKQNVAAAGFDDVILLKQAAFEDSSPLVNQSGTIITNPPYGERLQKRDIKSFYKTIGDVLKQKYAGWDAWLITSDYEALKSVGLRTSRKIKLFNGPLECRFVKYEMYQGSRKKVIPED